MNKSFLSKKYLFLNLLILMFILANPIIANANEEEAVFAGGCFWCLEHDLENIKGVSIAESGYSGGDLINPTYTNHEGHQEAVRVFFDSEELSYKNLLKHFWRNIDPLDNKGQFCDKGNSYIPVIFTADEAQEIEAKKSQISASEELGIPVNKLKVQIIKSKKFWLAENYHQDFAERNQFKYNFYRYSCGRDAQLHELWGENAGSGVNWTKKG